MMDDTEKYSEKDGNAFKNVEIRKPLGKISRVEPEFADQLPITWEQINQTVTQLMQLGNSLVEAALFDPNNAALMKKAIGLRDFYIPGEDDRTKQYAESIQLTQGVPVEPEILDNHQVHMAVVQSIVNSSRGQRMKLENPLGYQLHLMHWVAHQAMLPLPEENSEDNGSEEKPKSKSKGEVNGRANE
jgi:hypothetical protein